MRVMCLAVGRHMQLVSHELASIASLYGEIVQLVEEPLVVGRFFQVDFRSDVAAKCIVSRCVLLQAAFTVMDNIIQSNVSSLAEYFQKVYPTCFQKDFCGHALDVKALKKRIRSSKEKEALLGQFIHFNVEAVMTLNQNRLPMSLLIGVERCCLGLLVAQGLSPSTGSRGGRVGSGIAAKFSLSQRPYTGITTMDPELALVMANLARVRKDDIVLDPFAGSCGILLACAYFGMSLGFAHDTSELVLRGDGPGRDISTNFDIHLLSRPEICIVDVLCDPPYGVRTFGMHDNDEAGFEDQFVSELVQIWSQHLAPGGRMVFYVCGPPNHTTSLSDYLTTIIRGNHMTIVSIVESDVHIQSPAGATWSRSLVILEKHGDIRSLPVHVNESSEPTAPVFSRHITWNICRDMEPFDVWRAAWIGDVDAICNFEARGCNLNAQDENGKTPLYFASGYNQLQVVKYLIERVIVDTMDHEEKTALVQAARHGHCKIVELILGAQANPCHMSKKLWCPAFYAATYGHAEVLRLLHEVSAESITLQGPGKATPLHRAAERGHSECTDWMGRCFITYAVRSGHVEVLKQANTMESSTDIEGNTPLHYAVLYGRSECAQWLLFNYPWTAKRKNNEGRTPSEMSKSKEMHDIFQTIIH
ncbi:Aste57867_25500 [Aphanomyces stellatus]|uniref:Aste57867_25500 protein n=1 Tax=Aphanomyces stellatus TaxID=120398 RepID=A0A485LT76_9STRA|nr:hypothetical protein As57867_025421 [Aphanomyces stellatus]VFU02123.1 Aste57867_25500 [Aphanomyces stellatus]